MTGKKTKSSSSTTQSTTQTQTTPGTEFGKGILKEVEGSGLVKTVLGREGYTGDRIAAPETLDQYVAQWGAIPDTFIPQATATNAPIQTMVTQVDPFAEEGIDAGLAAAASNQTRMAPQVDNLYNYWQGITGGGGQNPFLQSVIDAYTTDFNEQSAAASNQRALSAGATGAFGGTPFQQGEAWAREQEAQAYGQQVAGLRYEDFLNTQRLMEAAPEQLAQIAQMSTIPAEQFAHYGGQRQANLQAQATAGDENAQRLLNNQWLAMTLNDENAMRAAQEAIAQWEAQYRVDDAAVRNDVAGASVRLEQQQAGMNNDYLRWLSENENLSAQIANLNALMGLAGGVPGQTQTGTGTSNTQTTTKTSGDALGTIMGAISGGVQGFQSGGWAGAAMGALGGRTQGYGQSSKDGGGGGSMSMSPTYSGLMYQPLMGGQAYQNPYSYMVNPYANGQQSQQITAGAQAPKYSYYTSP